MVDGGRAQPISVSSLTQRGFPTQVWGTHARERRGGTAEPDARRSQIAYTLIGADCLLAESAGDRARCGSPEDAMGLALALARGTRGQAPVCIRCAGTVQHAGSLVLHMCACLDM